MPSPASRADLAAYDQKNRIVDIIAIVAFFAVIGMFFWKLAPSIVEHPFAFLVMIVLGYIGADFTSGFIHWLGDTWGSPSTPVIGKMFIRPFREHHVDQTAITRHDFVETNGANCFASAILLLPFLLLAFVVPISFPIFCLLSLIAAMSLGLFATNQFHKWAHGNAPRFARVLQSRGIILSPNHHSTHHSSPFDTYYCITVGWMNPVLKRVRFFQRLERIISNVTGAKPRQNDTDIVQHVQ